MAINFILLQNRQGKTRFSKWYTPIPPNEKRVIEQEVLRAILSRDTRHTNFFEYKTHKIIYRRYQGLYFTFCIDHDDNELAYLEYIHFFVEVLDGLFQNVCELDLVFGFHRVYAVVDEMILGGEILELSQVAVLARMQELERE
ncbi:hypothetical protein P9112_012672 [Eukaryota sp. TZLM1-RC]